MSRCYIKFTADGTKKFAEATARLINQTISIYLDDEELMSPTVNTAITDGEVLLVGDRVSTKEKAEEIADAINHGWKPSKPSADSIPSIIPAANYPKSWDKAECIVKNEYAAALVQPKSYALFDESGKFSEWTLTGGRYEGEWLFTKSNGNNSFDCYTVSLRSHSSDYLDDGTEIYFPSIVVESYDTSVEEERLEFHYGSYDKNYTDRDAYWIISENVTAISVQTAKRLYDTLTMIDNIDIKETNSVYSAYGISSETLSLLKWDINDISYSDGLIELDCYNPKSRQSSEILRIFVNPDEVTVIYFNMNAGDVPLYTSGDKFKQPFDILSNNGYDFIKKVREQIDVNTIVIDGYEYPAQGKLQIESSTQKTIFDFSQLPPEKAQLITWLSLWGHHKTPYTDISGLANLTNLRFLGAATNDMSVVANMPLLEELHMGGSELTDLSALKGLSAMKTLDVGFSHASDISPLANLANLEILALGIYNVTDLSALSNLTNLKELKLHGRNDGVDVSMLTNLTKLERLEIGGRGLSDEERAVLQRALPTCIIH